MVNENSSQLRQVYTPGLINDALKQTGGNKQAAARLLRLKRTTFSAKLRRCGVIAPAALDESEEG